MSPNRLADSASAYLGSAAHQPVAWQPWGTEAFELAEREDKPILLDIGAAWCHWCHVMDGESYEDTEVAAFLEAHFVCVKVDRDERPDVDTRYQRAVQALTGQGGWPLTAFLTPKGEVFFGGTYFPPEGRLGRPGFLTVLRHVAEAYREERDKVAEQAASVRAFVEAQLDESAAGEVSPETLRGATDRILRAVDREFGGFGRRPKFPHPATVTFLLHRWCADHQPGVLDGIVRTLDGMAAGGIRDHVGGGFHRYSTDERWIIPHFEKMSYDNSELLKAYLDGYALFGAADHARVARETVRWVREVLALPGGGIGASQDADIGPGDDGSYFTWTRAELGETLGADLAQLAAARFGLDTLGRMEHKAERNVLFIAASAEQLARQLGRPAGEIEADLDRALELLREARGRRAAPFVDRTPYAAWNAMMVGALLRAEAVLGDGWAGEHALATLRRLRVEQSEGAAVLHGAGGGAGLLEDQVHVAAAALDAFEATGNPDWLDWSAALMDRAHADCWDPVGGGYFDTPSAAEHKEGLLGARARSIQDSPTPSPNGVAGLVLARLAELTREPRWDERRRRLIQAFGERAADLGLFASTYLLAVDWLLLPATHLVVTGPPGDPLAAELHRLARATFVPRRIVLRLTPELALRLPLTPALQAMLRDPGRVAGYACTGERCLAPVQDPEAWGEALTAVRGER